MTVQQENMLSRWSRRKRQSAEQTEQEDLQVEQQVALQEAQAEVEVVEEPVLTDEDMPPIESLHADSDFTPFMSSGVSDRLRNLALKRLFHVPVFNLRDGLDEYDEDYTTFETLGSLITSDMKHQMEVEAKHKLEQESQRLLEDDDTAQDSVEPAAAPQGEMQSAQAQPSVESLPTEDSATEINNDAESAHK